MSDFPQSGGGRSRSDVALLLLAFLLVFVGVFGLSRDLGLRRFFFQLTDDGELVQVGKLAGLTGGESLRRQRAQDVEFVAIKQSTELYNGDTVVTDASTTAVLEFQDGSRMELSPGSMVQLVFETRYGWDGIKRLWDIQVVRGSVTARAAAVPMRLRSLSKTISLTDTTPTKLEIPRETPLVVPTPVAVVPPTPVPVPTAPPAPLAPPIKPPAKAIEAKVQILSPLPDSVLKSPPKTIARQVPVEFVAKLSGVTGKNFRIRASLGANGPKVFEKPVTLENGTLRAAWVAKTPGAYRWEILTEDGGPVKHQGSAVNVPFKVDPRMEGIEILDPLIAGKVLSSNQLSGDLVQNFSVTLRWNAKIPVKKYHIWFGQKRDSAKALLEKDVEKAEYSFNKDRLFAGRVTYRVTAAVGDGWVLTSGDHEFAFNFLPPILVVPTPGTLIEVSPNDPEATVLFTWQKTNFTKGYEFQLSTDPTFAKPLLTKAMKDNLFVMSAPPKGHYYWRVRSYSDSVSSSFGKAGEFDVKR